MLVLKETRQYKIIQTISEMCGTDTDDIGNLYGRRSLWPKGHKARFVVGGSSMTGFGA